MFRTLRTLKSPLTTGVLQQLAKQTQERRFGLTSTCQAVVRPPRPPPPDWTPAAGYVGAHQAAPHTAQEVHVKLSSPEAATATLASLQALIGKCSPATQADTPTAPSAMRQAQLLDSSALRAMAGAGRPAPNAMASKLPTPCPERMDRDVAPRIRSHIRGCSATSSASNAKEEDHCTAKWQPRSTADNQAGTRNPEELGSPAPPEPFPPDLLAPVGHAAAERT